MEGGTEAKADIRCGIIGSTIANADHYRNEMYKKKKLHPFDKFMPFNASQQKSRQTPLEISYAIQAWAQALGAKKHGSNQ